MQLVVGNKNYSSWSMRPWVLLREAGIAFEEVQLKFGPDAKPRGIERYLVAGKVPVLILWFGLGAIPATLTAFLISFFPIVVNVATGLATTEPELEDVLRALGASKLDIMRKVGIPRSLPYFFGSLKVAITLAFVGAVVSETVGSNKGIGKLMLDAQAAFQVPIVFAGLLVLAVMGIVLYAATAAIETRFTGWAFRGQSSR